MAASFNLVVIIGTIGRDPEVKYTPGGAAVCEISLAVNRTWNDKASGTKKDEVTWVNVTLWGRTAEICGEYCAKGKPVLIEGRLATSEWTDKDTQKKRSKMYVVAESLQLLGSKGDTPAKPSESDDTPKWQDDQSTGGAGTSDEVPF